MEIWKEIPGYEGLYEVSSYGGVRRYHSYDLKLYNTNKGYLQVYLYNNGVRKGIKVHRLVAQTFIPNPDCLPQVNHKDENKTNNRVDNLEWCDCKYNIKYGSAIERTVSTKIKKGIYTGLSAKERQRKYNIEHKEEIKEWKKKYREENKEYFREYHKIYYQNHKDKWKNKRKEDE